MNRLVVFHPSENQYVKNSNIERYDGNRFLKIAMHLWYIVM